MHVVALRICGDVWFGVATAAYLLVNFQMNKGSADPMSDRVCCAARLPRFAAAGAGVARGASAPLDLGRHCAGRADTDENTIPSFWPTTGVLAQRAPLFLYGGEKRYSARRRSDHLCDIGWWMGGTKKDGQRAASFHGYAWRHSVEYAQNVQPHDAGAAPFDLDRPGGFYDREQNGYGDRIRDVMQETGGPCHRFIAASGSTSSRFWFSDLLLDMRAIDSSARRAEDVSLSIGAFNLLFYAAFGLDLPRTAVPAVALAAGIALALTLKRRENRSQRPVGEQPILPVEARL